MRPPGEDLDARQPVWDALQMFWMDTDPESSLEPAVRACAESAYGLDELEAIYWNEVRPAVARNLWRLPAPEWRGFSLEALTREVLTKHRFGQRLRKPWLDGESKRWWRRLARGIRSARRAAP